MSTTQGNVAVSASIEGAFTEDLGRFWECEKILAEKYRPLPTPTVEGTQELEYRKFFLIKWRDLDELDSTWVEERKLNRVAEQLFHDWQHHSMMQQRGREAPFDVADFNRKQQEYLQRKRQKRKRPNPEDMETSDSDSESDAPLATKKEKGVSDVYAKSGRTNSNQGPKNRRAPTLNLNKSTKQSTDPQTDIDSADDKPLSLLKASHQGPASSPISNQDINKIKKFDESTETQKGAPEPPERAKVQKQSALDPLDHDQTNIFRGWNDPKQRKKHWTLGPSVADEKPFPTLQLRNFARKAAAVHHNPAPPPEFWSNNPDSALFSRRYNQENLPLEAEAEQREADQGLLTCWFWANEQRCKLGAFCTFEHRFTQKTVGANNRVSSGEATCWYWYHGDQCNKVVSDWRPERCRFAHHITPYLGIPTGAVIKLSPPNQPQLIPLTVKDGSGPQEEELFGCFHFNFGDCRYKPGECLFPHVLTRFSRNPKTRKYQENRNGRPYWIPEKYFTRKVPQVFKEAHPNEDSPSPPPRQPISPQSTAAEARLPARPELNTTTTSSNHSINISRTTAVSVKIKIERNERSSKEFEVQCQVTGVDDSDTSKLVGLFDSQDTLKFGSICMDRNMKVIAVLSDCQTYAHGELHEMSAPGKATTGSKDENDYNNMADTLCAYSAAAVAAYKKYYVFIYPKGSSGDWKDLSAPDAKSPTECRLSLCIIKPPSKLLEQEEVIKLHRMENMDLSKHPTQERKIESNPYASVNVQALLQTFSPPPAKKVAFIFFREFFQENIDMLTSRLMAEQISVYQSVQAGSWDYFRKHHCTRAGGLLLIHRKSFDSAFLMQIPFLHDFLNVGRFNLFWFSDSETGITAIARVSSPPSTMSQPSPARETEFVRLFSSGQAVLIMDDCLVDYPSDTLRALRVLQGRAAKSFMSKTWIVGSPGFIERSRDMAIAQNDQESDINVLGEDEARMKIFEILNSLKWETDKYGEGTCEVFSEEVEHAPTWAALPDCTEEEALNWMVNWFAYWVLDKIEEARRICIISMAKSKTQLDWRKKFRHLTVMTPSQYSDEEAMRQQKLQTETKQS